jgi:hypothetical protein
MILTERCGGKRPFGTPRQRRDDNFKMEFQEVRWGGMD